MTPNRIRSTYTVATLEVPANVWEFVAQKLREAGYDHVFSLDGKMIDMTGIGLVAYPNQECLCGQRLA